MHAVFVSRNSLFKQKTLTVFKCFSIQNENNYSIFAGVIMWITMWITLLVAVWITLWKSSGKVSFTSKLDFFNFETLKL